jgi:hypothetical protein
MTTILFLPTSVSTAKQLEPDPHPAVAQAMLREMGLDLESTDIPIIKPPQIVLARRLQSLADRPEGSGGSLS